MGIVPTATGLPVYCNHLAAKLPPSSIVSYEKHDVTWDQALAFPQGHYKIHEEIRMYTSTRHVLPVPVLDSARLSRDVAKDPTARVRQHRASPTFLRRVWCMLLFLFCCSSSQSELTMNALRLSTRLAPRAFGVARCAKPNTTFSKFATRL